MSSYVGDSELFCDQFSTPEMRIIFDDRNTVQKWLDTEVALAQAEADLGLIPREAAIQISEAGNASEYDLEALKVEMDRTSHPIVPLVRAMESKCSQQVGGYLHWGATTQDIMDTGQILQIKDAWKLIENDLQILIENFEKLAQEHRNTIMAGRTHGQHALPLTFGFKVAIWIDELRRHQIRIKEAYPRIFRGQFSGAVGSMAALGQSGLSVQKKMFEILDLFIPNICWHSARDTIAEAAFIIGLITGTMGKIANEVFLLSKTEISELEEPFPSGKVGSSTMPHKRNPALCESIIALARAARYCIAPAMENLVSETERDKIALHAEREYVSRIHCIAHAAIAKMITLSFGLEIKIDKMHRNLKITKGLLLSESVMMALAPIIGRQKAHEVIYQVSQQAAIEGISLKESIKKNSEVSDILREIDIESLLDPSAYIGLSGVFVDRILEG